MNRKENYKDMEKYRKAIYRQKKRYYDKTATFKPLPWDSSQDEMVLKHDKTDSEISNITGHSVRAIQIRRARLKKWGTQDEQ